MIHSPFFLIRSFQKQYQSDKLGKYQNRQSDERKGQLPDIGKESG